MGRRTSKPAGVLGLLAGYSLGTFRWTAGFHCLEEEGEGVRVSGRKLRLHCLKLAVWCLELTLVFRCLGLYRDWILKAQPSEILAALTLKSVVFLYIKVFWPQVFPKILPGLHQFLCPQCYEKRAFKFLPLTFRLGFGVTYLCGHCSCLVDGWGQQVFYPSKIPFKKCVRTLSLMAPAIIFTLFIGILISVKICEYF